MPSGKGRTRENPFGKRRIVEGKELAPRSVRKKTDNKKRFLLQCTDEELMEAQVL